MAVKLKQDEQRTPDEISRDAARHEFRRISLWGMANIFNTQQQANNSQFGKYPVAKSKKEGEPKMDHVDLTGIPMGSTVNITNSGLGKLAGAGLIAALAAGVGFGAASFMGSEKEVEGNPATSEIIPVDGVLEWGTNDARSNDNS